MTNRTLQKNHHASPTPSAGIQPSLRWLAYPGLLAAAFVVTCGMTRFLDRPPVAPPGMVWIPGGQFVMGANGETRQQNELPVHMVRVDGFFMDETEVSNAQFHAFIQATGYVTVAQRPVDWEELKKQFPPGTPAPPAEQLQPGSLVVTPPDAAVPFNDMSRWW